MRKLSGWRLRGAAALVLLGATASASAADLGFYAVVDGAYNIAHISLSQFHSEVAAAIGDEVADTAVDTRVKGFNLTVGYQLGSYFGVEVRTSSPAVTVMNTPACPPHRMAVEDKGRWADGVGSWPVATRRLFLARRTRWLLLRGQQVRPLPGFELPVDFRQQDVDLSRRRAAWWITGQVALRLGYNWFHHSLFDEDASQYTLGLRYSYGY